MGWGNLSLRFVRDLKGLTGAFYGCKKDKKTSWLIDVNDGAFQCSKLGM